MATELSAHLRQELVELLVPHMDTESERQALLRLALPDAAYKQIHFGGPADAFTANMVQALVRYGEVTLGQHALVALLEQISARVGVDKQREIERVRQKLLAHFANGAKAQAPIDSEPDVSAPHPQPAAGSVFDQRSGGIYFDNNSSVHVQGDVINAGTVNKTTNVYSNSLVGDVRTWFKNTFAPADTPPHLATSWVGYFVYLIQRLTQRMDRQRVWTVVAWLTLWGATAWLVTPILRWPLDDSAERGRATLLYALAVLILPFFVALISPVDRQDEMQLPTRRDWARFWLLKLAGAGVGFSMAAGTIGVAMAAFYLGWRLPPVAQWVLAAVPLLFGHVGARRIPGDRLEMFQAVRLHDVDWLVLLVWLILGPGLAAFIYAAYATIANPVMGVLLLIAISGLLFWELQKPRQNGRAQAMLPDWARIGVFGLVLPLVLLFFIIVFALPSLLPSSNSWWAVGVVTLYFVATTLLVATLFVRNPPTLTIRGVAGVLIALLITNYVVSWDRLIGGGLGLLFVLGWLLWGRQRWRRFLWVHPSFGIFFLALVGSILLWTRALMPPEVILWGWAIAMSGLIAWAYREPSAS